MIKLRRIIAKSWTLSRIHYLLRGLEITGAPGDEIWYFAFGANMHDSAFKERRGMAPLEWRVGRLAGYRLRFNLEGRPVGKAAPANITPDSDAEVWGVLYRITRADLVHLDSTEGVPGPRYRHLWVEVEDGARSGEENANRLSAVTYIADGKKTDGRPSLRYITLLRDGARAHGLPDHWLRYLDGVRHAE
jgi:cation transport regulator ChaC